VGDPSRPHTDPRRSHFVLFEKNREPFFQEIEDFLESPVDEASKP
jgi:hypothetical protein